MIKTLRTLNVIFFLAMIAVNALANILPLGNKTTGDVSAKYANLYTPAPITFSIWGIIYIMVSIFIIYQLGIFGDSRIPESMLGQLGLWFVISCMFNIGWILSWHYERIGWSLICMIGLLFSLIMVTMALSPRTVETVSGISKLPLMAKLGIWGFDIYLGWICAATIANISVFLVSINWNGFGFSGQFYMILVLVIGAILGALFIISNGKYISAAAIVWAYCGILIKHISKTGYGGEYPLVIFVAVAGIALIIVVGMISIMMNKEAIV